MNPLDMKRKRLGIEKMIRTLKSWLTPSPLFKDARPLYAATVQAARDPRFYADWAVPDTLDGRFEMITLHLALVLKRLKQEEKAKQLAQELVDLFILDMDNSLREMGAGDMGVSTRIKTMAQGFYGRLQAYDTALDGENTLRDPLIRNVYGTVSVPPEPLFQELEHHIRKTWNGVEKASLPDLIAGNLRILS